VAGTRRRPNRQSDFKLTHYSIGSAIMHDKITCAVEACLIYSTDAERPFQQAADFFLMLCSSPDWSEPEVSQVKSLALAELISRAGTEE